MKAVLFDGKGGPEVVSYGDTHPPKRAAHEVRVGVRAAAMNRADLLQRMGLYPAPGETRQDVPGLEFAGVVLEADADGMWQVGDRVMALADGAAQAEEIVVDPRVLIRIPEHLDFIQAAAIPEAFVTAWDAMVLQARLEAGTWVLVHAAASGVGTAAIQLARWLGARVVGTTRTATKLQHLSLDVGIHCPQGFDAEKAATVRERTDGGVDVILDFVGASYLDGNIRALRRRGRMVCLGLLGGVRGELDLGRLLTQRLTLMGSTLRSRPPSEKAALAQRFGVEVMPAFAAGDLSPVVAEVMSFEDARGAHVRLAENTTVGKIILTWS